MKKYVLITLCTFSLLNSVNCYGAYVRPIDITIVPGQITVNDPQEKDHYTKKEANNQAKHVQRQLQARARLRKKLAAQKKAQQN